MVGDLGEVQESKPFHGEVNDLAEEKNLVRNPFVELSNRIFARGVTPDVQVARNELLNRFGKRVEIVFVPRASMQAGEAVEGYYLRQTGSLGKLSGQQLVNVLKRAAPHAQIFIDEGDIRVANGQAWIGKKAVDQLAYSFSGRDVLEKIDMSGGYPSSVHQSALLTGFARFDALRYHLRAGIMAEARTMAR